MSEQDYPTWEDDPHPIPILAWVLAIIFFLAMLVAVLVILYWMLAWVFAPVLTAPVGSCVYPVCM